MHTWLGASLAWLLGTALQLMSGTPSRWGSSFALAAGAGALCLALVGRVWLARRPSQARAWVLWALAGVAWLALAWGLTGWRALDRLEQRWPPSRADETVSAEVSWAGLPQRLPTLSAFGRGRHRPGGGGEVVHWQVEARVLRWVEPTEGDSTWGWPQRVQLFWERPAAAGPPRPGEAWRVGMRLRAPEDRANPGVGDGSLGRFARGVRAVGRVVSAEPLPDEAARQVAAGTLTSVLDEVDAWRQRVRDRILARVADQRTAGVLAGLAVGDQAAIAPADWVVLQRTGTAHLVSISGTHVALLGVLAAWLVRGAWSRSPTLTGLLPAHLLASWVALLVSALYASGAGWGVPAQRTVWMMAFATVLLSVGRRWPWPLLWLPGAALVAVTDPWALAQPGFWLSFVAVGVLLASGVKVPEAAADDWAQGNWRDRWREAGAGLLETQRLVAVALAPLAMVCFQQVSIVGAGVNVLAVPLFTLVFTPLALAGVMWPWCWDVAAWGLQVTWWGLSLSAQAPGAVWNVPALPGWVAACGVVAAFALALPGTWRWRVLALPFLLPFFWLPDAWRLLPRPLPGQFSVVVADVGQGGATLVRTARHTLLFDAGPLRPDGGNMADRVLLPMLQSLGVGRLDVLMVSHDDADHSGGAASLLGGIEVGRLMSPFDADHPLRLQAAAHQACEAGHSWTWDGVLFRVLHPAPGGEHGTSDNARSCVLQVEAAPSPSTGVQLEPTRLLLTADIEAPQERALLARWPTEALRSTVMLVPHHGSRTSSTQAWLEAVAPRQAVVQVGAHNTYGHPNPVVMRRYGQAGIAVVTTPACGAFVWQSSDVAAAQVQVGDVGSLGEPVLGRCWRATRTRHWQ